MSVGSTELTSERRRRLAAARVPGAELVQADFLELELPSESFDAVCSFYVFLAER